MPFQKGNKLACNQRGGVKPKTEAWNNIVGWLAGEGGTEYKKCLKELSLGHQLPKPKLEFMDRYEGLIEYHQPKLARSEVISNQPTINILQLDSGRLQVMAKEIVTNNDMIEECHKMPRLNN